MMNIRKPSQLAFVLSIAWLLVSPSTAWCEDLTGQSRSLPQAKTAEPGTITLNFLGTGSPRPSTKRYGPAILVEAGAHTILVDAGPGARERIFETGGFELLARVDRILVTHLHYDHVASIPDVWIAGWMYGRESPLHIFGPEGTQEMVSKLREAYAWDLEYRQMVGIPPTGSEIVTHDIGEGIVYAENDLEIVAFPVEHMPIDIDSGERLDLKGETLGFRINYQGRSVLFSGDTRSTENSSIHEYGKGVDVLVHEVQVPSPGESEEAKRANVSLSVHSTPEQAARIFESTKPGLAVYSHIIPAHTRSSELLEATRAHYEGDVVVAHDFMRLVIGDEIVTSTLTPLQDDVFEESRVMQQQDSHRDE